MSANFVTMAMAICIIYNNTMQTRDSTLSEFNTNAAVHMHMHVYLAHHQQCINNKPALYNNKN